MIFQNNKKDRLYMLCSYFHGHWPSFVTKFIAAVGESTAYILIIHTLFGGKITAFVTDTLALNQENIYNLISKTFIQVVLGTAICFVVKYMKKLLKAKFSLNKNRLTAA